MHLLLLACGFAIVPVSPLVADEKADSPKPNVLWIVADDLAPYMTGTYGHPTVRTPNLDAFARSAVRFDRAYCNSPVCTASRQSFLTGQYPRTLGVTQLKTPLPDGTTTLAHHFRDAGYETVSFGKMHFNSQRTHGFHRRLDAPDYQKWLKDLKRAQLPAGVAVQPPWKPFATPAREWLNGEVRPFAATSEEMPDSWLAMRSAEYLLQAHEKPFFLMVGFAQPHSPFHFPVEYRNRVKPESMRVPTVGPDDAAQIPEIFRDLTDRDKQGIAAAYATSVEFLDSNIGKVLDALARSGAASNTIVVIIGDHGYLLGHHGRFEKHCMYEEAIRSPLLIRVPGEIRKGDHPPVKTTEGLVEFVDLAPTFLDLCGIGIPKTLPGKSLKPILDGTTTTHRDRVFVEYSENEEAAVRTARWKLTYCSGLRERDDGYKTANPKPGRTLRLYDVQADPGEFRDLAKLPEHAETVRELTASLLEHLRKTDRTPKRDLSGLTPDQQLDRLVAPRDVN
jgi:choline-sulfatase